MSMAIQRKMLRVDRTKKYANLVLAKGANWCSLTDACVSYILDREEVIRKMFRYTVCCDELFAQTVIANSPFMEQVYQPANVQKGALTEASNVRAIDWNRGKLYTFDKNDYEIFVSSANVFARKVNNDTKERKELLDLKELLENGCELFQTLSFNVEDFYRGTSDGYGFEAEWKYT